ncbi:MAG: SRPBCC family protein [Chloroflexota bacterium]
MARVANRVEIAAPAPQVWAQITDVEAWPAWAPQMKRLERIDGGPLHLGSRIRVRPNGLPTNVWQVTEFEDGRLFTWETSLVPGLRLTGGHELTPAGDRTSTEFWLDACGPLGALVGPILRRTVFRRNTRNATEGLKRHMEASR